MSLKFEQLHDASLVAIHFDWLAKTCTFSFQGAPTLLHAFTLTFSGVTEVSIPSSAPWGVSVSVLEAKDCGSGKYELTMQSGDTISVVAPNYAIKVTAE